MRSMLKAVFALIVLAAVLAPGAQAAPEDFGLQSLSASLSTQQAGAHPDVTIAVGVKEDPASQVNSFGLKNSYAATRDLKIALPPGLTGDPNVLGRPQQCTELELASYQEPGGGCPNGSQVGVAKIFAHGLNIAFTEPIYMMAPPGGDTVARLGLIAGLFPTFVDLKVRSEGDYGLTAEISDASAEARLVKTETTIWGVPSAAAHDTERMTPFEAAQGIAASAPRPPGTRELPFMTNATRCGVAGKVTVSATSWPLPDLVSTMSTELPPLSGCDKLGFAPSFSVTPTSHRAGGQTGLDVTLKLAEAEGVGVLANSQLRDARVTFPPGMTIASGAADGLVACSSEQVGLGKREAAHCPDAAKIGSAEFDVPALERRMKGAIYQRTPEPGHLFRVWLVADDLGAHVKLQGDIELDPVTGQVHSIFLDNPQVPLRELVLQLKGGSRAPLANPPTCGTHLTHWEFAPWSGKAPTSGDAPMTIGEGCNGGGFSPKLSAGTTSPAAGEPSPFLLDLTREDGEANLAALNVTLAPGLLARLAGVGICEGAALASGACPASSRVGAVASALGPGPAPLWVPQPGKSPTALYLSGPYKGAPLSLLAVVPAQAGPFDLGTVLVRSAIYIDPETTVATVRTDPLPQILEGVPVTYRDIHVGIDRPAFTINPTSCEPMAILATATSALGQSASPTSRFQVGGCRGLDFKPRLSLHLQGGTKRGAHPSLHALLRARPGDANIAATAVTLPHSAFLDQAHIRTVCTRVQFRAGQCPQGSIYGKARAVSPLLDGTLEGPVYLRSSSNPLPDLVIALKGPAAQPVEVVLVGRVDSTNAQLRNSFELIPDAPVSEFELTLQGARKGLIVNSRNLCSGVERATVNFAGQNGKAYTARPAVTDSCRKQASKQKRRSTHHQRQH